MVLSVIALALLSTTPREPVGRRIVVPLSSNRGKVEVLAHPGEGCVDVVITGPGELARELVEKQAGEQVAKLEVVEQVQDKLHLRLFTATPFAHATARGTGGPRAVIDLRLHAGPDPLPLALDPPLLILDRPSESKDPALQAVWDAIDAGELATAEARLHAVKDPSVPLLRGELALLRGDARAAVTAFKQARDEPSTRPFAEIRLADLGHFHTEFAFQTLSLLNQRAEGDSPAMLARSRLLESGRLARTMVGAALGLQHLASVGSPAAAADALARAARIHMGSGHPELATESLLRAADLAKDVWTRNKLRVLAADAYAATLGRLDRAGRWAELVEFGEKNVDLADAHPERALLDLTIASAARRVGKIEIALKRLMKVAALDPAELRDRVLVELVDTYVQAGDLTRARTVLAYADESKRGARSAELARARADIAWLVGEHKDAHAQYVKSAQLSSRPVERAECLSLAAEAAFATGARADAKSALEALLALSPPRGKWEAEARLDLGVMLLEEGQPAKAAQMLAPIRTSSIALEASKDLVAAAVFFEAEAEIRSERPLEALGVLRTETSTASQWARFVDQSRALATIASKETAR